MYNKDELVQLMVRKLERKPAGYETTVCDIINEILSPEEFDFTIEDLFEIDSKFRSEVIKQGMLLDSMKHDLNPGLPFDMSFVLRKV